MLASRVTSVIAGATFAIVIAGCATSDGEPEARPTVSENVTSPDPTPTESARGATADVQSTPSPQEQQRLNDELIAAAWDDDVARARDLIRDGADVNYQDDTAQSAYLIAASEGYLELLELTLDNGAKIDDKDSFNGTALIRAAERGHADVVGRLVQAGIDLDHVNNLGWTALHEAVILADGTDEALHTVRVLVAAGVDVAIPTGRDGQTALEHARTRRYDEIAAALDAADREVSDPRGTLLQAAADGDSDAVAVALRAGADIEVRDGSDRTPLLLAAAADHVDAARVLLYLGADPDAVDGRHDTPWLVTGVTGSVEMAELLLVADPDLTAVNRFGGTSLIPASERGHVDYVRRVVRTEIDVNHVNNLGWTALLEAVMLGEGTEPWQEIVETLLDNGADPAIADYDGVTPLEHARSRGFDEIARILVDAQA
jgi:uncharacterized protein